jgi:predicted transcriptional regulator
MVPEIDPEGAVIASLTLEPQSVPPEGTNSIPKHTRGPDKKPRRKYPKRGEGARADLGMGQEMLVGQMKSLGVGNHKIADMLRISRSSVNTILARPQVQEFISQTREAIRHVTLAQVQQAQEGVGDWLKEVIQSKDAKSFDSVARGVLALEKTSASASGENRPVGTQIAIVTGESQREQMGGMLKELLGHYETVDIAPPTPKP